MVVSEAGTGGKMKATASRRGEEGEEDGRGWLLVEIENNWVCIGRKATRDGERENKDEI